ncbi:MAG: hypothetical protein IH594_01850 [Bacteroidales bacterium]|nr:hypothetical protein [Bacteroidales bacterium]
MISYFHSLGKLKIAKSTGIVFTGFLLSITHVNMMILGNIENVAMNICSFSMKKPSDLRSEGFSLVDNRFEISNLELLKNLGEVLEIVAELKSL